MAGRHHCFFWMRGFAGRSGFEPAVCQWSTLRYLRSWRERVVDTADQGQERICDNPLNPVLLVETGESRNFDVQYSLWGCILYVLSSFIECWSPRNRVEVAHYRHPTSSDLRLRTEFWPLTQPLRMAAASLSLSKYENSSLIIPLLIMHLLPSFMKRLPF